MHISAQIPKHKIGNQDYSYSNICLDFRVDQLSIPLIPSILPITPALETDFGFMGKDST